LTEEQAKVREYHERFGCTTHDRPTWAGEGEHRVRVALIEEELAEFRNAGETHDLVEIADALADRGRSNGYLTAIQEQLVVGYAASAGDAPSLSAASAMVRGLAEMTSIPDSIVRGYLGRWQSLDDLDPAAAMVRLLEAPVTVRRAARSPFGMAPGMTAALTIPGTCRLDRLQSGSARDRLAAATIQARARGIVTRRARLTPDSNRPAWAHAILGDVLWDPGASEDMLRRTSAAVLEGVARAGLIVVAPPPFGPGC